MSENPQFVYYSLAILHLWHSSLKMHIKKYKEQLQRSHVKGRICYLYSRQYWQVRGHPIRYHIRLNYRFFKDIKAKDKSAEAIDSLTLKEHSSKLKN